MAVFTLGALQRDMLASLDLSTWLVTNTATTGTASAVGRLESMPTFRQDRIEFTGSNMAYDGVAKARGTIETISYKSYGLGYYEQFSLTGLKASYQELVTNKVNVMPILLKGHDTVLGNDFDNTLYGFAGNDTLKGGKGNDKLYGGTANDNLVGGAGADLLDGGNGTDTVSYTSYDAKGVLETSSKGVSASLLTGKGTAGDAKGDTFTFIENLSGTRHADTLIGDNKANVLNGLDGNDWLDGGKGNDTLIGGAGNDTLLGGAGNDHIHAGTGTDNVWLGAGSDVLHFAKNDKLTTVYDFDPIQDRIDLSLVPKATAKSIFSFIHDTDNGAVIDFGNGDQIVLLGIDKADLSANDFLF